MTLISRTAMLCLAMFAFTVQAHDVSIPENIEDLALTEVADDVYVIHGMRGMPDKDNKGSISNTGIVVADEGVVIIDTGGSLQYGEMMLEKLRGVTDKPVVAVFNTHLHGDHWLGNVAVRNAHPDVKIYAHENAIGRLSAGEAEQWLDIFMQATDRAIEGTRIVMPDNALEGDETLSIAGDTWKLHHTGKAHTDGDIMIEHPRSKVLFAGDIVIVGSVVSGARPQDFSATGQIAAVEYALGLPVDTYVPGHGPTGGHEVPKATGRFLQTLYDSVQRHYEDGLQDFEMRDMVVAEMAEFSGWSGMDQIGRLISFVYQQVEAAEFE